MNQSFSVSVRPALKQDLDILVKFNAALAWETEQRRLDPSRLRSGVESLLLDPQKGWYAVAELVDSSGAGSVVGQLLVTFEWSDWRNGNFWWLQSVYVHPDFRRKGIFRRLHAFVKEEAKRQKERICGFRLYVDRENRNAHRTYDKFGFQGTLYHMYECEFPEETVPVPEEPAGLSSTTNPKDTSA